MSGRKLPFKCGFYDAQLEVPGGTRPGNAQPKLRGPALQPPCRAARQACGAQPGPRRVSGSGFTYLRSDDFCHVCVRKFIQKHHGKPYFPSRENFCYHVVETRVYVFF